jgi:murein DD-endopeptidase
MATSKAGKDQSNQAKRGCDVLTGPRKRTFQLIGLFSFSLIATTGSPAHSARSHRYHHWYGHRSRRNYSTSVKRTRTKPKQDRTARSTREPRADSLAQRAAWLKQRSTQTTQVSALPTSRGLTASTTDRRSASDLEAALARRRATIGIGTPTTDPSATVNTETAPAEETLPLPDTGLEPSEEEGTGPPVAPSPWELRRQALVRDALTARGIRYRWGGTSRGGFDCSGFTRYMMARNLGVTLPHSAHAQAHYGQKVAIGELQEGDLVFFRTYRRGISHVGIYIGDNRFIHAPRTGRTVAVETLTGYYRRRYVTARRLAGAAPPS